jgi:hypothetical protein
MTELCVFIHVTFFSTKWVTRTFGNFGNTCGRFLFLMDCMNWLSPTVLKPFYSYRLWIKLWKTILITTLFRHIINIILIINNRWIHEIVCHLWNPNVSHRVRSVPQLVRIVTCIAIAGKRVSKHIPATYAHATIGHLLLGSGPANTHH